jgi:hypothetical protein
MNVSQARAWFDEAHSIADPIERSQAMGDLAFDAEQLAKEGRRAEATELFELLATLDRYDDLLLPAIESADEHLILLGAQSLPPLDDVLSELHHRFAKMPERDRLLAVAKTLVREHSRHRPESWNAAAELLERAAAIQPLGGKELRFKAEVQHGAIGASWRS